MVKGYQLAGYSLLCRIRLSSRFPKNDTGRTGHLRSSPTARTSNGSARRQERMSFVIERRLINQGLFNWQVLVPSLRVSHLEVGNVGWSLGRRSSSETLGPRFVRHLARQRTHACLPNSHGEASIQNRETGRLNNAAT